MKGHAFAMSSLLTECHAWKNQNMQVRRKTRTADSNVLDMSCSVPKNSMWLVVKVKFSFRSISSAVRRNSKMTKQKEDVSKGVISCQ